MENTTYTLKDEPTMTILGWMTSGDRSFAKHGVVYETPSHVKYCYSYEKTPWTAGKHEVAHCVAFNEPRKQARKSRKTRQMNSEIDAMIGFDRSE